MSDLSSLMENEEIVSSLLQSVRSSKVYSSLSAVDRESLDAFLCSTHNDFLRRCLISRDWKVEEAKNLILNFIKFRLPSGSGWGFEIVLDANLRKVLDSGVHCVLPGRSYEGHNVVYFRPSKLDFSLGPISDYQRMGAFLIDYVTTRNNGTIDTDADHTSYDLSGTSYNLLHKTILSNMLVALIVDLSEFNVWNATRFTISDMKRGLKMWQNRYPVKLRRIVVINAGFGVTGFFKTLFFPFLPTKFKKRIIFISSPEALHRIIPPEILPQDISGAKGLLAPPRWISWQSEVLKILRVAVRLAEKSEQGVNDDGENQWWKKWCGPGTEIGSKLARNRLYGQLSSPAKCFRKWRNGRRKLNLEEYSQGFLSVRRASAAAASRKIQHNFKQTNK